MCFNVANFKPFNKPLCLDDDIPCYKRMKLHKKGNKIWFVSECQDFHYPFNGSKRLPKVNLGINFDEINEGYHSYPGRFKLLQNLSDFDKIILPNEFTALLFVNMLIPRKTLFYFDPLANEYVSECIKFNTQSWPLAMFYYQNAYVPIEFNGNELNICGNHMKYLNPEGE